MLKLVLLIATLQCAGCAVSRTEADGSKWSVQVSPTDKQLKLLGYSK